MSVVRNQTVCQLFGFPVFAAENEAHGMGEAACVSAPPTLGMSAAVADTELLPAAAAAVAISGGDRSLLASEGLGPPAKDEALLVF